MLTRTPVLVRTLSVLALFGFAVAAPSPAHADPVRRSIWTSVDPCVPLDRAQFQHLLAIELGPTFDQSADPNNRVASVSLTCTASGIQLQIEDAVTRKSMTRVVDLSRVPEASRSRLMALAVTEFLTASWLELRLFGKPLPVEPVAAPPTPSVVRSAARIVERRAPIVSTRESDRLRLGLTLDASLFTSELRPIPCLSLRVEYALSAELALHAGIQVGETDLPGLLQTSLQREHVQVHLTMASLLLGLLYRGRVGDFDLSVGAGARIGFAYLKGAPPATNEFTPESSYVPWAAPAVVLGLAYRPATHLRIVCGAEVGPLVVRDTAVADGVPVTQLTDLWSSAYLGIAWSS